MSWSPSVTRSRMDTAVGIALRTPGLFVIDYWYWFQRSKIKDSSQHELNITTELMSYLVLINGFLLLLLPISILRSFYSYFVCGALILSAHFLSYYYVRLETGLDPVSLIHASVPSFTASSLSSIPSPEEIVDVIASESTLVKQISILFLHIFIAIIVSCLLNGPQRPIFPILACYTLPVMARLAHFPPESVQILHKFSFAVVGLSLLRFFLLNSSTSLLSSLKGAYHSNLSSVCSVQGLMDLVVSSMSKIFVPTHFLLFWVLSFGYRLSVIVRNSSTANLQEDHPLTKGWYVAVLTAAAGVCSSPVSLFATTVTVTYVSSVLLSGIKLFLGTATQPHTMINNDNADVFHRQPNQVQPRQTHTGWEEGVTTLLLAVLTGITEMKEPSRMAVLTIILFVVLSSLLQSMLEIAEPVILSLSVYHGKNIFHHIKVLFLCAFLFVFPLHVTYILAQIFPVDFWMAVVLSTSVLTSAQVLDLVIVHCLLWFDATRSEPWDPLDEVVYYVRGVTKIIEFLVAFSVVIVGVYEAMTGPFSWTNAFILLVHCYFNVCQRLQQGIRSFVQRRRAVKKSSYLPNATEDQLVLHKDVCAICFMDLMSVNTSVVTPCTHFFHRVCLRRWLSFQDRCPLCSAPVISDTTSQDSSTVQSHSFPSTDQQTTSPATQDTPNF